MKRIHASLLFSAVVASCCLCSDAQTAKELPVQGDLTLNVNSGPAPLTVKITGPDEFLKPAKAHQPEYRMGCPYNIDWGDGKPLDRSKRFDGMHTYDAPGIYIIRATLIKWNPDDSTTVTWSATSQVNVAEPGAKR